MIQQSEASKTDGQQKTKPLLCGERLGFIALMWWETAD